jgi:hypothetical protein
MTRPATTRVEELTLRLIDGQIAGDQREELVRLVTTDGEARRVHLALLTIEATLRGHRRVEVSDDVMTRIDDERTSRIVRVVMGELDGRPAPRPRLGWWRVGAIALLLMVSAAAAVRGVRSWAHDDRAAPVRTEPATARR